MLKVYSKDNCPKCVELKEWLSSNKVEFEVIDVVEVEGVREFLMESGFRSVPQVFDKEGNHIGGCDDTILKLSLSEDIN